MGFFDKIFSGLTKTRTNMEELEELFKNYKFESDDFYEELEDLLVMSDIGAETTDKVIEKMRLMCFDRNITKGYKAKECLMEILMQYLEIGDNSLKLSTKPSVILMVGVNGVGKTTTIGKLAANLKAQGKKVILGAADTFRAAAADQLQIWAERAGVDLIRHAEGADPAAVVFDTITAGKARGCDVIICDTAGRLHNKKNLMDELSKISRVIDREAAGCDREVLLVIDATTGQNGVNQAREFKQAAGITGIVLTKLDGTAKGGIVIAIKDELGLPVKFVGVGEQIDDLQPFITEDFVNALFE